MVQIVWIDLDYHVMIKKTIATWYIENQVLSHDLLLSNDQEINRYTGEIGPNSKSKF